MSVNSKAPRTTFMLDSVNEKHMNIAQPNCVLADPGVMGLIEEDGFTKFTLNGDHFNQQC